MKSIEVDDGYPRANLRNSATVLLITIYFYRWVRFDEYIDLRPAFWSIYRQFIERSLFEYTYS